jgi:hypothetical protein
MKNRWIRTEKFKFTHPTPGVYKATTSKNRVVYTYAYSAEDAHTNLLKSLKWEEEVKCMSRVTSLEGE